MSYQRVEGVNGEEKCSEEQREAAEEALGIIERSMRNQDRNQVRAANIHFAPGTFPLTAPATLPLCTACS